MQREGDDDEKMEDFQDFLRIEQSCHFLPAQTNDSAPDLQLSQSFDQQLSFINEHADQFVHKEEVSLLNDMGILAKPYLQPDLQQEVKKPPLNWSYNFGHEGDELLQAEDQAANSQDALTKKLLDFEDSQVRQKEADSLKAEGRVQAGSIEMSLSSREWESQKEESSQRSSSFQGGTPLAALDSNERNISKFLLITSKMEEIEEIHENQENDEDRCEVPIQDPSINGISGEGQGQPFDLDESMNSLEFSRLIQNIGDPIAEDNDTQAILKLLHPRQPPVPLLHLNSGSLSSEGQGKENPPFALQHSGRLLSNDFFLAPLLEDPEDCPLDDSFPSPKNESRQNQSSSQEGLAGSSKELTGDLHLSLSKIRNLERPQANISGGVSWMSSGAAAGSARSNQSESQQTVSKMILSRVSPRKQNNAPFVSNIMNQSFTNYRKEQKRQAIETKKNLSKLADLGPEQEECQNWLPPQFQPDSKNLNQRQEPREDGQGEISCEATKPWQRASRGGLSHSVLLGNLQNDSFPNRSSRDSIHLHASRGRGHSSIRAHPGHLSQLSPGESNPSFISEEEKRQLNRTLNGSRFESSETDFFFEDDPSFEMKRAKQKPRRSFAPSFIIKKRQPETKRPLDKQKRCTRKRVSRQLKDRKDSSELRRLETLSNVAEDQSLPLEGDSSQSQANSQDLVLDCLNQKLQHLDLASNREDACMSVVDEASDDLQPPSSSDDGCEDMVSTTRNEKYMKAEEEAKIQNKTTREKFSYIYKRSLFRQITAIYSARYKHFINGKRINQKKLREQSLKFIESQWASVEVPAGLDREELGKYLLAILHQNKFNNPVFEDIASQFQLMRGVSHNFSQTTQKAFFDDPYMSFIFFTFASDPSAQKELAASASESKQPGFQQRVAELLVEFKDAARVTLEALEQ